MTRIPLTCEKRQGEGYHYDAPYITGQITIAGHSWTQTFLVDTGASATSLNGVKLDGLEEIWKDEFPMKWVDGVGKWPARVYKDCSLAIQLPGGDPDQAPLQMRVPKVAIFAPYLHIVNERQEPALNPAPPFPRSKRIARGDFKVCKAPNLLGRDVFRTNLLRLAWDPLGESYIEVNKVA